MAAAEGEEMPTTAVAAVDEQLLSEEANDLVSADESEGVLRGEAVVEEAGSVDDHFSVASWAIWRRR